MKTRKTPHIHAQRFADHRDMREAIIEILTPARVRVSFCSARYPIALAISAVMIKIANNSPVVGPEADLNTKMIAYMIGAVFFAGICSGFLGIGGGVIKGPILLVLGID
jgi:hypothetical protein